MRVYGAENFTRQYVEREWWYERYTITEIFVFGTLRRYVVTHRDTKITKTFNAFGKAFAHVYFAVHINTLQYVEIGFHLQSRITVTTLKAIDAADNCIPLMNLEVPPYGTF